MKFVENILVPIDFSEESMVGLKAAVKLAQKFKCTVHTSHFILPHADVEPKHPKEEILGISNTVHDQQLSNVRQESYDRLHEIMQINIPEKHRGHACIVGDSLGSSFEDFTKNSRIDIDLVVTGDAGSRNLVEVFTGTRTDKLIRNTDIPVLAISEGEDLLLDNILILTDLGTEYPEKIMKLCRSLHQSGSTVHFLNVITTEILTEEDVKPAIDLVASDFDLTNYKAHVKKVSSEIDGIKEAIDEIKADLVLMKTYNKSNFVALIAPSLAEKVVRETSIPVILERVGKRFQ